MKKCRLGAMLALVIAGLMALALGCASGASAPQTPKAPSSGAIRGVPSLAFDKLQANLGTVAQDQQGIETFLLINRGDRPLKAGPVKIQVEQGCDVAETVQGDISVPPLEAALLPVKFGSHKVLGPHKLLVNVPSNDPARPMATLSLHFVVAEGEAPTKTGPRLRVDKEVIDIGTVPHDWPLFERFTLRNEGTEPLVLKETPVVRVEDGC